METITVSFEIKDKNGNLIEGLSSTFDRKCYSSLVSFTQQLYNIFMKDDPQRHELADDEQVDSTSLEDFPDKGTYI